MFGNKISKIMKISKAIRSHDKIIIQRHQDPDPDAYGSQFGLAELIRHSYPDKQVSCVGSDDPELDWIGKPVSSNREMYQNALVIVTDCANRPRISGQHYNNGDYLIKIDHHPDVDQYGDIDWTDPQKSSASEMICDLCFTLNNSLRATLTNHTFQMDAEAARCLYAGIIGDTGRFMFAGVTDHTFNVVAKLANYDFSMPKVNQKETETTANVSKLYGYLQLHMHYTEYGTAWYVVTQEALKKFNVPAHCFISKNLPGNVKGVIAWAYFKELPDQSYKVSLRSQAPAINHLAAKHHGGGHALASGAKAKNIDEVKEIIQQLNQIAIKSKQSK